MAVLYAGRITLGEIQAVKLKRLAMRTGGLDRNEIRSIAQADCPLLEDLEIWFGNSEYGANGSIEDLEPLLGRQDLRLKRLGLMNMEFGDDICKALVSSPLLAGLQELDLTMGVIGEEGAKALISAREKFTALKTLRIAATSEQLRWHQRYGRPRMGAFNNPPRRLPLW